MAIKDGEEDEDDFADEEVQREITVEEIHRVCADYYQSLIWQATLCC